MGKLLIIRHGHTGLNIPGKEERLRGWLDIPLDAEGQREAAQTAEQIGVTFKLDAVYCSDLKRARQSAEFLRHRTNAPLTITEDLRPWNLGIFGGQRVSELIPFLNLLNQNPEMPAPGGESFDDFYERFSRRLLQLLNLAEKSPNCIAVVAHVRNMLAAPTIILGGDKRKIPSQGGPHTGDFVIVEKMADSWKMSHVSRRTLAIAESQELTTVGAVLRPGAGAA
jgi:broad specificity phosphatase PhoE